MPKKPEIPDALPDPTDLAFAGKGEHTQRIAQEMLDRLYEHPLVSRFEALGILEATKEGLLRAWARDDAEPEDDGEAWKE